MPLGFLCLLFSLFQILKYTPEDYYDRENLEIALEKAEDICSQVNEGVRSQENSNRLEWLQERVNLEGLEEVCSLFRDIFSTSGQVLMNNRVNPSCFNKFHKKICQYSYKQIYISHFAWKNTGFWLFAFF